MTGQTSHPRRLSIATSLVVETSRKKVSPMKLRDLAYETIGLYPRGWVHCYTDGSSGRHGDGSGASVRYPEGNRTSISYPCDCYGSSFNAEAMALLIALQETETAISYGFTRARGIVVFTDCLPVLQDLDRSNADTNNLIGQVIRLVVELKKSLQTSVHFQWVPAHVGVEGNEAADRLAKKAAKNNMQYDQGTV